MSAFHWSGQAAIDSMSEQDYMDQLYSEREQSFLFYAISLECIFGRRGDKDNLTDRIATRCGKLLGKLREGQLIVERKVRKLYDLRSRIVHEGNCHVSASDLGEIRQLTKDSLIILLTAWDFQQMRSEQEYERWFEPDEPSRAG